MVLAACHTALMSHGHSVGTMGWLQPPPPPPSGRQRMPLTAPHLRNTRPQDLQDAAGVVDDPLDLVQQAAADEAGHENREELQ